jgi:hypothetical protein
MNNNNHFNTNNWIGTTHLDFFKNSSNALSNYTYNTSNILENDILINSNINYLYTSNSSNSNIIYTSNISNIILDRYDKLIKEEEEQILLPQPTTLKHTYIYNENEGGQIRFQNQAYITDVLGFPPGTPNYKVKIDIDGKLKLYWVYNPLISLIYFQGWHEPLSEIAGLTADSVNQGGLITALQGEVVIIKKYTDSELSLIWAYIEGIQEGIITPGQTTITPAENARDMLNWGSPEIPETETTPLIPASPIQNANALSTFQERIQGLQNVREIIRDSAIIRITDQVISYITQNPITSFFLGTGFTTLGIAYSILQGIEYNRYYNGVIENVIQNNSNLSAGVRLSLHNLNQSNIIASNLIDFCSNTYYLGINQGFINSNIITQQYINSINTNQITLNNKSITSFSLSNIDNFVQTQYGTYYDITNGTLAINSTPTLEDFFRVGGQTTIQGQLICEGKIKENNLYLSNVYTSSNVLSNTSNTIFNNYSNLNLTTSNNLANYTSNNSNYFSNLNLTTSNNLANYTSNNSNYFSNLNLTTSNNLFNYSSNLNFYSLYSSNSNIYTTSNAVKYIVHNEMPRVNKKSAFYCQTNQLIYPDGSTPYYAYHIDLRDYVATGYIDIGSGSGDTYRIFKIKCFFGSCYFQKLVNNIPDIVDYTILMSNKQNAGGDGTIAGVNILARGEPINPFLDNLMKNNLFILRNNTSSSSFNFNYLSILTPQQADIRVFIECLLS